LAPFICFTARKPGSPRIRMARCTSSSFSDYSQDWRDVVLAAKWDKVRDLRRVVTGPSNRSADKKSAHRLQAIQGRPPAALVAIVRDLPMDDICITSDITIVEGAPSAEAYTCPMCPVSRGGPELATGEKWPALLEGAARRRQASPPRRLSTLRRAIGLMARRMTAAYHRIAGLPVLGLVVAAAALLADQLSEVVMVEQVMRPQA